MSAKCALCPGESVPHSFEMTGKWLCAECLAESTECRMCGNFVTPDDLYIIVNGVDVCRDCFALVEAGAALPHPDSHAKHRAANACCFCGSTEETGSVPINGVDRIVCKSCVDTRTKSCDFCGEQHLSWGNSAGGPTLCSACRAKAVPCPSCGLLFRDSSELLHGEKCERCVREQMQSSPILQYSYKPPILTFVPPKSSGKDTTLYLGLEHEVCGSTDCAINMLKNFSDLRRNFHICHDGSVEGGFEVVTQPRTLKALKEAEWLRDMLAWEKKHQVSGDHRSCGLHIHLSRSFFTPREVVRIVALVKTLRPFIERLALRKNNSYARFMRPGDRVGRDMTRIGFGEKYDAVNLLHSSSIELRFFAGTSDYNVMMASIELAHAIAYFTKGHGIGFCAGDIGSVGNAFINFCRKSSDYTTLVQMIGDIGADALIPTPRVRRTASDTATTRLTAFLTLDGSDRDAVLGFFQALADSEGPLPSGIRPEPIPDLVDDDDDDEAYGHGPDSEDDSTEEE